MGIIEKKIRIGIICDQFGNLQRGGAEVQLDNTVKYLRQNGEVEVEFINYETRDITQFDLVHIFKSVFEFTPVALALKKAGIPYVVSTITFPRNYYVEMYTYRWGRFFPGQLKSIFSPARRVTLWDQADCLFPNTDMEAEFLRKVCPRQYIEVIPNGIDLQEFTEATPELFYSAFPGLKDKKFVLNVARVEKRKNQKNLLLACRDLGLPLVVVGKIGDEAYFKEIQELKYPDFYYLGAIYERQLLFSAYTACTLFCLPSTLETPGIAAMEAAYYNKPVVVTKYGGTRSYFKDRAGYVDWKDVGDIRRSIVEMLNKPRPQTREFISEYSWDKIAARYVEIYRHILAGRDKQNQG